MQLFLSYSRTDAQFAKLLASSLETLGHSVWIDAEDIVASGEDRWRRSIVNGITRCDAMLLVLSPNSVTSQNVEREVTVAAEMKKRIAPVMYQQCELPAGLMYELAGVQRIDFTQQSHEEAVSQLDHFLRHLDSQSAMATVPTTLPPTPTPPPTPPPATPRGHRTRNALIGAGLVAVIIVIAAVTSGGSGDGSSDATSTSVVTQSVISVATETTDAPAVTTSVTEAQPTAPPVQTSTEPSTTIAVSQRAIDIVGHWAAETTARNWDAVLALSMPDQNRGVDKLISIYGPLDDPHHLETLNAYIAGATVQDGLVYVEGARIAWDYFEDPRVVTVPPISTNVGCREWVVDVGKEKIVAETFVHDPALSGGERIFKLIQEPDFPGLYATYCHAGG